MENPGGVFVVGLEANQRLFFLFFPQTLLLLRRFHPFFLLALDTATYR